MRSDPALQLRQSRALAMTPELRDAIGLLRMSNAELSVHLAMLARTNPSLRIERPTAELVATLWDRTGAPGAAEAERRFPQTARGSTQGLIETAPAPASGLHDHARHQAALILRDPADLRIAAHFIEALESSGWLGEPLAAIAAAAGCDLHRAEAVLARLQQAEPAGLFARSLAECLTLQARDRGMMTPAFAQVLGNLPMLAEGDLAGLARIAGCDVAEVRGILGQIRRLDPKPGARFDPAPQPLREPDLIVRQRRGGWLVELNRSTLPGVFVAEPGAVSGEGGDPAAARWLEHAVARRNQTLLRIGEAVVARQARFLTEGPEALRPMRLADLAAATGLHESTISRAGAGLLLATPRGTVALRALFSAALRGNGAGAEVAAAAVRHRVAAMIAAEDAASPLSDAQIAGRLSQGDVRIARRTVAKYREQQGIPGSADRRRRARLDREG